MSLNDPERKEIKTKKIKARNLLDNHTARVLGTTKSRIFTVKSKISLWHKQTNVSRGERVLVKDNSVL